jgi:hypothetical protein
MGTPADAASEVVQDSADDARKAASVNIADGAGSTACVIARGAPAVAAGMTCP